MASPLKILVAEDDPDIQLILRMVLIRLGKAEVVMTYHGDQVIPLAKTHHPNLILLDMMLPEMSGLEICRLLKADPQTQSIPVIFLTARSMAAEIKQTLDAGALGHLSKPFDPMTLISQINGLLSSVGCSLGG